MSKIPDDSWLEDTAVEVASMTGLPLAEARRLVYEAEQRALADGRIIEVGGVRWAVRPSSVRLAESEGDELMAARLRRALAWLAREGREPG